jgi:flagellar hook protein FlgE
MGIFDALNTSVAGLQAQSFALQNISGNIANAQTTGYKGIGTSFVDLIPDSTNPSRQVAGGVTGYAQATITTQGTVSASTVGTYMAINGDGFFAVQKSTGTVDHSPVFSGVTDYTRRGDFQVNSNGNLVNGSGYYLMGVAVDPKTGNPLGNVPTVLQFQNNFVPAQTTTAIQYAANLPATPTTTASTSAAAGTITAAGGLNPADFTSGHNPLVIGTPAPPYGDATNSGASENNKAAALITGATTLSGAAGSDSLSTDYVSGNTITVNGTAITFTASGGLNDGTHIPVDSTITSLLGKIDAITGTSTPSTISGGVITLHSGTASDLSISSNNASAFASLGFAGTETATRTGGGTIGAGEVIANDLDAFQSESISGGAVTAYDSTGTPVNLQLRWVKSDSASLGAGHTNTWNLFYQSNPNATGAQVAWTNVGTNFVFGPNGSLTSPTTASVTISNASVAGQTVGDIAFNFGSGGLTQYASTGGNATVNSVSQNGYAAGQLQSVAINNNGLIVGTFSNGQNLDLAAVSLAHFNGTNYLKALDGGAYAATDESGAAIAGASGTISGSSLEGSNADVAEEFTKLIVTQQAYSANTKVITTANSMVQDLLNVLR